jgi:hypothetical protein
MRFYSCLQKGLYDLKETSSKKNKEEFPRLAPIMTQMLAEFLKILPNKLHVAYNLISNHLIVKEKFSFTSIPEYLILLQSHSMQQHEEQRIFLLSTVYHGIKDKMDLDMLNNMPLLKMIMAAYGCPLSSRKIDLLILKIIDRIVTKADGGKFLMKKFGLALWLFLVSTKVEPFEYDAIQMIVTMVHNVLQTDAESSMKLLTCLLTLLPKLSKNKLPTSVFNSFLDAVVRTNKLDAVSKENVEIMMDIAKVYLPAEFIHSLTYLSNYPDYSGMIEIKNFNESESSVQGIYGSLKKILLSSAK